VLYRGRAFPCGAEFGTQYQRTEFKFERESVASGGGERALPRVKEGGALVEISESLLKVQQLFASLNARAS
jgi:hypothetical protein